MAADNFFVKVGRPSWPDALSPRMRALGRKIDVCYNSCCQRVAQYSSQPSVPEGGAKNPPKGTSMKFLVLAWGAQPWADAGS